MNKINPTAKQRTVQVTKQKNNLLAGSAVTEVREDEDFRRQRWQSSGQHTASKPNATFTRSLHTQSAPYWRSSPQAIPQRGHSEPRPVQAQTESQGKSHLTGDSLFWAPCD